MKSVPNGNYCMVQVYVHVCFEWMTCHLDEEWNVKQLTLDDGQTWDEGIHYPAYQDVCFTDPFQQLFFRAYNYSLENLCRINNFRVNAKVKLETRGQERRK